MLRLSLLTRTLTKVILTDNGDIKEDFLFIKFEFFYLFFFNNGDFLLLPILVGRIHIRA